MNRPTTKVVRRVPPDGALAALDAWMGGVYLFQSNARMPNTGIYLIARDLMSMRLWGIFFLALGVAVWYAAYIHHGFKVGARAQLGRTAVAWIQIAGPALYVAWSVMALISALISDKASFTAFAIYAFLAYRHTLAPDLVNTGRGAIWYRRP